MYLSKLKLKLYDFYMIHCRTVVGSVFYYLGFLCYIIGWRSKFQQLVLASIRYSYSIKSQKLVQAALANGFDFMPFTSTSAREDDACGRAIILSPPQFCRDGAIIKGVVVLTFSHTFSYFLRHPNWPQFNEYFVFVLEPSWAGYADPDIISFVQQAKNCVIEATEINDRVFISNVFPTVPCIDIGASNWVDPHRFVALSSNDDKDYDAIYIASMSLFKRVLRAIDVVKDIKKADSSYKLCLVCASWGGEDIESLEAYVESGGLKNNIDVFPSMSQADLVLLLNRSKCSILMSLKEGSNRVLFESMFANVPVVCISENIGVNKSYINSATGMLVSDQFFASALSAMKRDYRRYTPRAWATSNISPSKTTEILKNVLTAAYGASVNMDLLEKVNAPEVRYRTKDIDAKTISNQV
ncbi:hypothetical protein A3758_26650, partial [Oleiphilus sp. HI0118]